MSEKAPLLSVENLHVRYRSPGAWPWSAPQEFHAVKGINFSVQKGETLALVGESGCGKSSTARALIGLHECEVDKIHFNGKDFGAGADLRQDIQLIFQDPYSSLDPRQRIGRAIAEPLVNFKGYSWKDGIDEAKRLLNRVGLDPQSAERYPHAFSGGQRQRIVIARALACQPKLLICDEPVSALDVSVQAQILDLLRELQAEHELAMIFISHDLAVVHDISQHVAVMFKGEIVEMNNRDALYHDPQHPYTKALLSAVPIPDPQREQHKTRLIYNAENNSLENASQSEHIKTTTARDSHE